jgi:hypothetical protein
MERRSKKGITKNNNLEIMSGLQASTGEFSAGDMSLEDNGPISKEATPHNSH